MYGTATVAVIEISPELNSSLFVGVVYIILPILLLFVHLIFNMASASLVSPFVTVLRDGSNYGNNHGSNYKLSMGGSVSLITHHISISSTNNPKNGQSDFRIPTASEVNETKLVNVVGITTDEFHLIRRTICNYSSKDNRLFPDMLRATLVLPSSQSNNRFSWSYTNEEGSVILALIEYIACMPFIICTFIIYIMIAATVLKNDTQIITTFKTDYHLRQRLKCEGKSMLEPVQNITGNRPLAREYFTTVFD
uniref:Ion transport domain-containing protein n=1 Tax=Angiostrongylus cantonensis TaxID=6313 RepID=A0A0K0DNA3_ANGCA